MTNFLQINLRPEQTAGITKSGRSIQAIYSLPRYGRTGNPGKLHLAMDS
jgi:hypothetical protein